MGTFTLVEQLERKWQPVMEHDSLSPIKDNYRRAVTSILLENQEQALREASSSVSSVGADGQLGYGAATGLAGYDPILISLVRRAMPNLMAYDVASVQPMTSPTGLIFAMKSTYNNRTGAEALFNEAYTRFSGGTANASALGDVTESTYVGDPMWGLAGITGLGIGTSAGWEPRSGMSRDVGEGLGETNSDFNTMAFTIDRSSVTAKTRALKAEYTIELAQDLKAIHGLDAETELANILSTEILAEINREVVRSIYITAKLGCQHSDLYNKTTGVTYNFRLGQNGGGTYSTDNGPQLASPGGVYDLLRDSDGRWSAEKFRGLMFQIEREANVIAKDTRRGKGNFLICSADVASALAMGGFLNVSPALNVNLDVDDTGSTFVGVMNGKMKVYVDPYSTVGVTTNARDFVCVGYKGTSPYDAGLFYCPYIPLQMVRAINDATFQPKIGFKTRYGMAVNPFVDTSNSTVAANYRKNMYYRIFRVDNLHGMQASL